jgi:tetratricopeptide (TPR) repeat protein
MLSVQASARPTVTEVAQVLRQIRDFWRRFLRRSAAVALLCVVVLTGAKYVLDITRAVMQAEAARGQIELVGDLFGDTLFNKLGVRDRQVMSEQFWGLMVAALQDLPDRLLRESVARFDQRILGLARIRLSAGDSLGAQAAFSRALELDELTVAPLANAELRQKLLEIFKPLGAAGEGRAEVRSALASYQRAIAFYERQLARGSDSERWRTRLALLSMPLGWTCLQSGDFPAARSAFLRAEKLWSGLLRESSGIKRRQWNYYLAEVLRALAETGYYAGNLDLALQRAKDSVRVYESLAEEMPMLPDMHGNLGEAHFTLGRVLKAQGDTAAALKALEKARAILTALHKEDPNHSRFLTLLALDHLAIARISRQRGELSYAQDALAQAAALTDGVTTESLFIAQDARAQALLELGRVQDARPIVEHLTALGWQKDLTHQDFAKLYKAQQG